MITYKIIFVWLAILIALSSCEQEELQNTTFSPADFKPGLIYRTGEVAQKYEVIHRSTILDRGGYQRLKINKTTGSELYAEVKNKRLVGYQIRLRNGRAKAFAIANRGGQCPDLWVCIHPKTGKPIYYDKCVTKEDPCEAPCSDLT